MIELTAEQRLGLNTDAPRVFDPQTRTTYVLVKEDVYERLEALLVPDRLTHSEQQAALRACGIARRLGRSGDGRVRSRGVRATPMNVQRGDVVMVDWLFSDRTGSKRRPALVVQADVYNVALDDTILALITGSARRRLGAATQLEIDIASPHGMQTGLAINSVVQCENLVTVDRQFIQRIRGRLSAAMMQKINGCLKAALEIS